MGDILNAFLWNFYSFLRSIILYIKFLFNKSVLPVLFNIMAFVEQQPINYTN